MVRSRLERALEKSFKKTPLIAEVQCVVCWGQQASMLIVLWKNVHKVILNVGLLCLSFQVCILRGSSDVLALKSTPGINSAQRPLSNVGTAAMLCCAWMSSFPSEVLVCHYFWVAVVVCLKGLHGQLIRKIKWRIPHLIKVAEPAYFGRLLRWKVIYDLFVKWVSLISIVPVTSSSGKSAILTFKRYHIAILGQVSTFSPPTEKLRLRLSSLVVTDLSNIFSARRKLNFFRPWTIRR